MCFVQEDFAVDINRTTLLTTLKPFHPQLVIQSGSSKSESQMGILRKSIGAVQGHAVVEGIFEICENTKID